MRRQRIWIPTFNLKRFKFDWISASKSLGINLSQKDTWSDTSSSTKARKPSIKRLIAFAFAQDAVSRGFIGTQRRMEAVLSNLMTQALSNMFSDPMKEKSYFRKLFSRNCLSWSRLQSVRSFLHIVVFMWLWGSRLHCAVLRGHFRVGQIDTKLINTWIHRRLSVTAAYWDRASEKSSFSLITLWLVYCGKLHHRSQVNCVNDAFNVECDMVRPTCRAGGWCPAWFWW